MTQVCAILNSWAERCLVRSESVDSSHVPKERLRALMFDTVYLTEEEEAHIWGWKCPECRNAMLDCVHESSKAKISSDE
jgi:hypothetical protein